MLAISYHDPFRVPVLDLKARACSPLEDSVAFEARLDGPQQGAPTGGATGTHRPLTPW